MGSNDHDGQNQRLHHLFKKYVDAVRIKLRRLGLEGADLEDLIQTVYAVANRRIAKIPKDEEGSRRWLLDAARKHAANWHRLYRHTYETLDQQAVNRAPAQPEDIVGYLELRDLVRRTGMKLDPLDREILLRHELDGESLQEIARWLGLTKSGAHVRLTQARERFIDAYESVQRKPDKPRSMLLLPVFFVDALREALDGWLVRLRALHVRERLRLMLRAPLRHVSTLSGPAAAIIIAVFTPPRNDHRPELITPRPSSIGLPPPPPLPVQLKHYLDAPPNKDGAPADAGAADAQAPKPKPPPRAPAVKAPPPPTVTAPPPAVVDSPPRAEEEAEEARKRRSNDESIEDLAIAHYALACFNYGEYDAALAWIKFHEIRYPRSQLRPEMDNLARMAIVASRASQRSRVKLPRPHPSYFSQSAVAARFASASGLPLAPASISDAGVDASVDASPDAQEPAPTQSPPDAEAP